MWSIFGMKRAFRQILGFIIIALLFAFALTWLSDRFDAVFALGKIRMKMLLQKANSIEALAVGHSGNRSIDFSEMELRGYHLWLGGSDLFETDYLLTAIIPMLPNVKIVFIPIHPLDFRLDHGPFERHHEKRKWYYATTPTFRSFRLINGDLKNLVRGKLSAIIRTDHWEGVVKAILSHDATNARDMTNGSGKHANQIDEYGYMGPRKHGVMNPDSLTARWDQLRGLLRMAKEYAERHPEISGETDEALRSSIRTLRKRNIRVIFFTAPITEICQELLIREEMTTTNVVKEHMQKIEEDFGIDYYDFSQDTSFTRTYDYFFNEDHLNAVGAKLFSRKLKDVCGF